MGGYCPNEDTKSISSSSFEGRNVVSLARDAIHCHFQSWGWEEIICVEVRSYEFHLSDRSDAPKADQYMSPSYDCPLARPAAGGTLVLSCGSNISRYYHGSELRPIQFRPSPFWAIMMEGKWSIASCHIFASSEQPSPAPWRDWDP